MNMKKFSVSWVRSKQTRKQRKYRYNAPLHKRQKMLSVHLDKALRKEYKKRSLPIRRGDEIIIMRGKLRKKKGKISRVDMKSLKVYVENIKKKKSSAQEVEMPIEPSNIMITKLNLEDRKRKKALLRKEKK